MYAIYDLVVVFLIQRKRQKEGEKAGGGNKEREKGSAMEKTKVLPVGVDEDDSAVAMPSSTFLADGGGKDKNSLFKI